MRLESWVLYDCFEVELVLVNFVVSKVQLCMQDVYHTKPSFFVIEHICQRCQTNVREAPAEVSGSCEVLSPFKELIILVDLWRSIIWEVSWSVLLNQDLNLVPFFL